MSGESPIIFTQLSCMQSSKSRKSGQLTMHVGSSWRGGRILLLGELSTVSPEPHETSFHCRLWGQAVRSSAIA